MIPQTSGSPIPPPSGGTYTTGEVVTATLPVAAMPGSGYTILLRTVVPASPGAVLDVTSKLRAINNTEYSTVAVSYGLWFYDAQDELPPEERPWNQLGDLRDGSTDQVRTTLHMPVGEVYRVPSEWPAGHLMVIAHRADAYAPDLDPEGPAVLLDVDTGYGSLTVGHWHALP